MEQLKRQRLRLVAKKRVLLQRLLAKKLVLQLMQQVRQREPQPQKLLKLLGQLKKKLLNKEPLHLKALLRLLKMQLLLQVQVLQVLQELAVRQ